MQPEREVDPPSRMRHQKALMLIVETRAGTAATHHAVPIGAGASAPEVLVQEVLAAMNERFAVTTENITTAVEEVVFKLPRSLTA